MSDNPTLTLEALKAQYGPEAVSALLANAPKPIGKITWKIATKGGISVYGLQRWPVTLYAAQWEALLVKADDIRAFITAHPEASRK